jgi:YVTN family beta-propeller protein
MSNIVPPITAQIASNAPIPAGLYSVTAPLVPDQGVLTQMSNFPPETYNLVFGSSIVKLMSTLTGPAGGGQFRQRQLIDQLRGSVSSTYFTDLDNSLGAALGISRNLAESLPFNPYTTAAPSVGSNSWVTMAQADATYRDRLFQVLRAISTYGPSPIGLKLIAESFLLCPCELTEGFRSNTVAALTATPTKAYYITITPHVAPTPQQQYGLMKILNKIKPVNTVITLGTAPGVSPYTQVLLSGAYASSSYWEVDATSSAPSIYGSTSVPQFAFGSSQGMAWTVNGSISGVLSYCNNADGTVYSSTDFEQITWADGTITNYIPLYAMTPSSESVLGNLAAPGNSSANPFNADITTTSEMLLSGAPLSAVQTASTITAQISPQFWSTPTRAYTDISADIIEVRFSGPMNVNAISFQLANFPHTAYLQVYDDATSTWVAFYSQIIATSSPAILPNPVQALAAKTHPQHFGPNCWVPVAVRFDPVTFSRARIVLVRPGPTGPTGPISSTTNLPAAYSLGVTEFSIDFIVDSAAELTVDANGVPVDGSIIGTSTDVAGNTITYTVYSEPPTVPVGIVASGALAAGFTGAQPSSPLGTFTGTGRGTVLEPASAKLTATFRSGISLPTEGVGFTGSASATVIQPNVPLGVLVSQWRCFPQPVNNAVVNLYLDSRDDNGNAQTIDRFFVIPTHLGVACTLYFSIVAPDPDTGTEGDMASLPWILVNRQYQLMTGWMTFPPTAAMFWKLEMTNLVAEMLTNPFPVTADILTFGSNAIPPTTPATGYQGALPPGAATQASLAAGETVLSVPAVNQPLAPGSYASSQALVATDPTLAQLLQQSFANYGYMNWQPFGASPVTIGGLENYVTTTIASINQVGFFTGFSSIIAYRTNPASPMDTPLYYELFYDALQIASSNCVTTGGIYSGSGTESDLLSTPAVVTSHAYVSASDVIKVQFATTQSPAAEIVPFDTFQNGRYLPPPAGSYAWDDQGDWNTVGMGDVQVSFNAQTLTPTITRGASEVSPNDTNNGIVSAPFQTSPKGYVTFAVRLNIVSVPAANPNFFTEYPIYLQLCLYKGSKDAPTVLQEWALSATTVGQTVEEYFSYLVGSSAGGGEFLCLAVAQRSGATCPTDQTASWTIQAASGFDPSIVWSFSSDSSTWVDAVSVNPVRNNINGITSLPLSSTPPYDLYWKCTIYRPDMYVTSLKLRPWYSGTDRPRLAPVAQGPNVTFSDPDQTIWTDPEFNTWALPVPIWWFARYAQLNLFPDGVPTVLPTSNHYVLTADESIGSVTDTSRVSYYQQLYKTPEHVGPVSDVATAHGTYHLTASESVGPTSDSSTAALVDVPAPPGNVYVTNQYANTVTKINLSTFATVGSALPVGSSPYSIAVDPTGTYAYVANEGDSTVTKINLSTFSVVGSALPVGSQPESIAVDPTGTYAYVANEGDSTVTKINLSTFSVVGSALPVGSHPVSIAIDPAGNFAYTVNESDGTVTKINLSTFATVGAISVGAGPYSVAVDSTGTYAYVTSVGSNTVDKINLSTFTTVGSITVTADPASIAIDSTGTYAYVVNLGSSTVVKIKLSSFVVIGSLAVGRDPLSVAIDPTGTYAYVTNFADSTVTKINLSTFTTVGSLAVGSGPRSITINNELSPLPGLASGGLVASFTGSDTGTMQVTHFVTLNYLGTTGSGTVQDWMVPLNLIGTTVQVVVTGGGCGTTAPSYGGQVTATVPATSGETFQVYVGESSFLGNTGGWGYHTGGGNTAVGGNPGYGGAGSSALLTSLGALLVEAGGAGGMGGAFTGYTIGQSPYQTFAAGGNGGGAATSAGTAGTFSEFYMELGSTVYWGIADGGYGATQSVAGVGGYIFAGSSPAFSTVQQNGNPGTVGGAPTTANGGLGVQSQYCNSGGGGGGYAGGGSGAAVGDNSYSVGAGAAGGGGSSWAGGGVSGVTYAVPASTAGSVTIIWTASS